MFATIPFLRNPGWGEWVPRGTNSSGVVMGDPDFID
jgi:hypothetical protein